MASQDGRIVYENTLDARLDVVFRQKLPQVFRVLMFPLYKKYNRIASHHELLHIYQFDRMTIFLSRLEYLYMPNCLL